MPWRAPAAREHQATPSQGAGGARGALHAGAWGCHREHREEQGPRAGKSELPSLPEIGISPCLSALCRRQGEAEGPHAAARLVGHHSRVLALPMKPQQLWQLLATSIFASLSGGATNASDIRGSSCAWGERRLPRGAAGTFQATQAACSKYRGKNCIASRRIFLLAAHREMVLQV